MSFVSRNRTRRGSITLEQLIVAGVLCVGAFSIGQALMGDGGTIEALFGGVADFLTGLIFESF